jgi:hypothetical protein
MLIRLQNPGPKFRSVHLCRTFFEPFQPLEFFRDTVAVHSLCTDVPARSTPTVNLPLVRGLKSHVTHRTGSLGERFLF